MRKLLILLFSTIILTACGNQQTLGEPEKETSGTQVDGQETSDSAREEATVDKGADPPKVPMVNVGESVEVEDFIEFTVQSNKFGKVIEPPNPSSFYTYYENKEDNQIYFDTVITVKNLLTTGKSSDEFLSVKIVYDDKYEYSTFSAIEEQGGSNFTYTNITKIEPLQTGTLHYLASVPADVENDEKPLKAIITANGKNYELKIR